MGQPKQRGKVKDVRLLDLEDAVEKLVEYAGRTDITVAAWRQLVNVESLLSCMDETLRLSHIALTQAQLYMPKDEKHRVQPERDLIVRTRDRFKNLMGFK